MNREDLFEAIGTADEAMLERSEKKVNRKRNWLLSVTAAAVCVAVLLGIIGFKPYGSERSVVGEVVYWPVDLNYNIPDSGSYDNNGIGCGDPAALDPTSQFGRAMSVHMKIEEILPDIYCFYQDSNFVSSVPYRILRLKVLDTIVGEKVPSEIFYLLPAYLSLDILEYDSFIVTIDQVGLEDYVMVNATQKRMETFTLLFKPAVLSAGWGSVLAFSDNALDTGLWNKDGWKEAKDDVLAWISESGPEVYPGKINRTVQETKEAILHARNLIPSNYNDLTTVVTTNLFDWKEARAALKQVEKNGFLHTQTFIYAENLSGGLWCQIQVQYTRVIDGFPTNEYVSLQTYFDAPKETVLAQRYVHYSYEQFTEEDLENLPDLKGFVKNAETLPPPIEEGETQFQLVDVDGEYQKYEGYVFGYVVCSWNYETEGNTKTKRTYYLICPDNTYREVDTRGSNDTTTAMNEWIAQQ